MLKPKPLNIINHNISKDELDKINYYYIKGGAGKLLNYLLNYIKKKNIKIFFNSILKKINLSKNNKKKITCNKKKFLTDQVYIPHYCCINLDFLKKSRFLKKKSTHIIFKFSSQYNFKKKFHIFRKLIFQIFFDRMSNLSIMMDSKDYYFCLRLCENFKFKFYKNQKIIVKKIKEDLLNFLQPSIKNKNDCNFIIKFLDMRQIIGILIN